MGFGISFIWSAIDYNCWYCWIVGIGLINMASFLVLVMVYVIKHDRNKLGYILSKIKTKQIEKPSKIRTQLKRAPSMIGCHVCGVTYEKLVNYCEKCGAKIIKLMSENETD